MMKLLPRLSRAAMPFELGSTEITKYANMSTPATFFLKRLCEYDTTSYYDNVNIRRTAFEEQVAHIATYHIALYPQLVGSLRYHPEHLLIESPYQVFTLQINPGSDPEELKILEDWLKSYRFDELFSIEEGFKL